MMPRSSKIGTAKVKIDSVTRQGLELWRGVLNDPHWDTLVPLAMPERFTDEGGNGVMSIEVV